MTTTMDQYGLLVTGFNAPTFVVVRADVDADIRAAFGASTPLGDRSLFGHVSAIWSERETRLWNLGQALYVAGTAAASARALEDVSAITGTLRTLARPSTVTETLTGTPATPVPSGTRLKTTSTGVLFQTSALATIGALSAWTSTHAYNAGDRVTNSGKAYQCKVAGTSAGSGGPTTLAADITDGSVHWTYLGNGTGAVDVAVTSVDKDAVVAVARDLAMVVDPVGGLSSVINLLDADLGAPLQGDPDLRVLRAAEVSGQGAGNVDAIRAALLEQTGGVKGVTAATVFANQTDVVDSNGLLPHSILALVQGGADADIAAALFAKVSAGDGYNGTTSVVVTDSEGVAHTVKFQRPTAVPIYVRVTASYDVTKYPADGDAEIRAAIATFGTAQPTGKDAVPSSTAAQAFSVAGVFDAAALVYTDAIAAPVAWAGTTGYVATPGARSVVTNDGGRAYICITSGTSAGSGGPSGVGTDITDGTVHWRFLGAAVAIDFFSLATWDTSRIAVVSTAGTP